MFVKFIGKSEHLLKSYPEHKHEFWEIIYNTEGEGLYDIENKLYSFSDGNIIVIPPNTLHYKYSEGFYSDIYLQVSDLPFKDIYWVNDDADNTFKTLIEMCYRIFHKQGSNYTDIINSLWETMLRILINLKENHTVHPQIEEFKNLLINHISDPEFKIHSELSRINYSTDHFRRLFKSETGFTPTAYLQNLRINYAKLLLQNKNIPRLEINDIAYMCGFYDQRYFGRLFKNKVGLTPTEFCKLKKSES